MSFEKEFFGNLIFDVQCKLHVYCTYISYDEILSIDKEQLFRHWIDTFSDKLGPGFQEIKVLKVLVISHIF